VIDKVPDELHERVLSLDIACQNLIGQLAVMSVAIHALVRTHADPSSALASFEREFEAVLESALGSSRLDPWVISARREANLLRRHFANGVREREVR